MTNHFLKQWWASSTTPYGVIHQATMDDPWRCTHWDPRNFVMSIVVPKNAFFFKFIPHSINFVAIVKHINAGHAGSYDIIVTRAASQTNRVCKIVLWLNLLQNEVWTKWRPFCKRHFEIHFHDRNILYFGYDWGWPYITVWKHPYLTLMGKIRAFVLIGNCQWVSNG